jgi:hypothetical protein
LFVYLEVVMGIERTDIEVMAKSYMFTG